MAEKPSGDSSMFFTDELKNIHFQSTSELAKKSTGLSIAKKVYSQQTGQANSLNFFAGRSVHWNELEMWSLGKQNMSQFLPFMNIVDANKSYAKIDMTPTGIGAQFVGTKVESISKTEEYPCVKAIDDDSVKEKDDRYWEAIFRMKEVPVIDQAQQASGVQLEPSDAYVPDDELSAKVYFELEDRLPKEIRFEKLLSNVLQENDYNRVLKPRLIRDNVVFNMECTKVEKVHGRKYSIRRCIPKNVFYNFFLSDSGKRELSYIGEGYNLKVKDLRSKYGITDQNKDGLTEEEIFELARKSSQNQPANPVGFNFQFSQQYSIFNNNTPWDDFSIYVSDFEIEVKESDYYVTKEDSYGKKNVTPKNGIPKPTSEKAVIQKKDKSRWYRGVYAPFADMMIYWGKPDLTILNYTDTEKSFCSYSINIPNNNGEYAPSLFERALEPLKEYALTKLKRKLLLSKLSPATYRVDVESARNILTGDGNSMDWEEIVRIKDTTGVELWSSKGLDPLTPNGPTFSAATQDPTLGNIIQLSNLLDSLTAEIRVLLGVPIYLDGSDVGQRTAAKLAAGQTENSFNVTGFIGNGHNQVMEETLQKICILAWQDIVTDKAESSNDLINTRFKTTVKMKVTDYEKQLLEQDIQRYSQVIDANGNPAISPKDAMMLRNIEDFKLACWYLAATVEQNRRKAIEDSQRLQQQNAEVQQRSSKLAADEAQKLQEDKLAADKDMKEFESTREKELALLNGLMQAISKGIIDPNIIMPAIQQLVPNITIPLAIENKQVQEGIMQQQQMEMQQQMEEEQGEGQQMEMEENEGMEQQVMQ